MGTTSNFALRYPALTDTPDGATQIQNLADDTDAAILAQTTPAWVKPIAAVKTGGTSRASTTVLTADPGLTTAVTAGATYDVELVLFYNGANAAGYFKWDFIVPAGATFPYSVLYMNATGTLVLQKQAPGSSQYADTTGTGNTLAIVIKGILVVSSTVSPFSLSWAQNASNATATTLEAYSKMTLRRGA